MRAKSRASARENKKMMKNNEANITFMAKFKFNLVPRRFVNTLRNFAPRIYRMHTHKGRYKVPSILANTFTTRDYSTRAVSGWTGACGTY